MTRVKRGSVGRKYHRKLIKSNSGYRGSHSRLFETANQQNMRAKRYSYFDRRKKKSNFKRIWIQRINGISKKNKITYSKIIQNFKKSKILLNKKILAKLAIIDQKIFTLLTTI
uniref:ribosomal protein L20 n=1 Tax=Flexiglena variabilis TaxID=2743688 RepID=UPI0023AA6D3C|nr:ribosomal protein L20 [Flexiglena variabilis]WCH63508.1 ribosomal protein L20 [Flexiglena variabilis]